MLFSIATIKVVATDYDPYDEVQGDQYINGEFVSLREYKINNVPISRDRRELQNIGASGKTDLDITTSLVRQDKVFDTFEPVIEDLGNYSTITYRKDYVFEADVQVITISNDNDIPYYKYTGTTKVLDVQYKITPEIRGMYDYTLALCGQSFLDEYGDYKDWTSIGSQVASYKCIRFNDDWRPQARNLGVSNTPITFQIVVNPAFSQFPITQEITDVGTMNYVSGWAGVVSCWNEGYDGDLIEGQSDLMGGPQDIMATPENKGYANGEIPTGLTTDVNTQVISATYNGFGVKATATRQDSEGENIIGEPKNSALSLYTSSRESIYQSSNYEFDDTIVDKDYDVVEFDYTVKYLKPLTVVNEIEYSGSNWEVNVRRTIAYEGMWGACFKEDLGLVGDGVETDTFKDLNMGYMPYQYKIYDVYLYDTVQFRVPVFVKYRFDPLEGVPTDLSNPSLTTDDTSQNWTLGVQTAIEGDTVWGEDWGVFGEANTSIMLDTSAGADFGGSNWLADIFGGVFGGIGNIVSLIVIVVIIVVVVVVYLKIRTARKVSKTAKEGATQTIKIIKK